MKRMNFIKYIAAALVVLSFGSCDDFLTQVDPNHITTDSFWKDLNDTKQGLNTVYNQFRDMELMGSKYEIPRSDEAFPGWGRPNTANEYYLQTFNVSSVGANNKWKNLYKGVFRANQVIAGLNGIEANMISEDDKEAWKYQMGQARFFRGLFYHYLHSSFNNGSVILFDFVPASEEDFNRPLAEEAQIKAFLRADLVYALENLPEKWTDFNDSGIAENSNDLGRVTSGAAAAVLGKSYLFEGDYTTAAIYFKGIIDAGNYRLMDDINDNFTANNEFNQESILEISYNLNTKIEENSSSDFGTSNSYNMTFSPQGGYRSLYPANWLIMNYKNDPIDPLDTRNVVGTDDNGNPILRKYSLRTSYSIAMIDDESLPYYGFTPAADAGKWKNGECAYWRKMTNWENYSTERDPALVQKSGINYRVIRYSDVLLMYAECMIKGGSDDAGVQEALNYINKVRYRSALMLLGASASGEYAGSTYNEEIYTAESLMEHIMHKERPLELSAEGYAIRQIDLRRWGITKERFEDLASREYWADKHKFVSSLTGKNKTRGGTVLMEGTDPGYTKDLSEFTQAAVNYRDEDHAYWPIPVSESTANSMVN